MTTQTYDVAGIGNAIVDVLTQSEDSFLEEHGLIKGAMTLVDETTAERLYGAMGSGIECSGGSAANTVAGIASLGGRGAFVGKVRKDQLGQIFAHDIRALGVAFTTVPAKTGPSTARCMIMVTPDAQRTMQTYLGASVELGPEDVDAEIIAAAQVTYLEGYLWDRPAAKQAFILAATLAHEAGNKVALSLSDPFCVDRHREDFLDLLAGHVDILFANEQEILSLYQVDSFEEAVDQVRGHCEIAALTRSEKGSAVINGEKTHEVPAEPVRHVVDTTGAGDSYAAGFLYGLSYGFPPPACARIGGIAAAEIIGHFGARPEIPLSQLMEEKLG